MLEELYDVLYQNEYLTQDFDTFKTAFDDEEYKRKVYDLVYSEELFTQDFDIFNEAYSVKKQDGTKTDAVVSSEDTASKLEAGSLVFGDQRNFDEKETDFEKKIRDFVSGDFYTDAGMEVPNREQRIEHAKKLVPPPPGSPQDQHIRFFDWIEELNTEDPNMDTVKNPMYVHEDTITSQWQELKDNDFIDIKQLADRVEDEETSIEDAEESLILRADTAINKMIEESDYVKSELMPYIFDKYQKKTEERITEMISNGTSPISDDMIRTIQQEFERDALFELENDLGYKHLVQTVINTVSNDLNADLFALNKSKEIPNFFEGSDILEGTYKFGKMFQMGWVGEDAMMASRSTSGLNMYLSALNDPNIQDKEAQKISRRYLNYEDNRLLYPTFGTKEIVSQDSFDNNEDRINYIQDRIKQERVNFIEATQDHQELQSSLQFLHQAEIFDGDFSGKDFKSMIGEQVPQMAAAFLSFGYSTYIQEGSGIYFEGLEKKARMKFGDSYDKATGEEQAEMLISIVDEGNDDVNKAITGGVINAGLDYVGTLFTAGKVAKAAKGIGKEQIRKAFKGLTRGEFKDVIKKVGKKIGDARIDKNLILPMFIEGATELSQEVVSSLQVARGTGIYEFDMKRYAEAFAQGAIMSGVFVGSGKAIKGGIAGSQFLAEEAMILDERLTNKNSIINYMKLKEMAIESKAKIGNISNEEAKSQLETVRKTKDIVINENLYKVEKRLKTQAYKAANDIVENENNDRLGKAQKELDEAKKEGYESNYIKSLETDVTEEQNVKNNLRLQLDKVKAKDAVYKNYGKTSRVINETKEGIWKNTKAYTFNTLKQFENSSIYRQLKNVLPKEELDLIKTSGGVYNRTHDIAVTIRDNKINEIDNTSSHNSLISLMSEDHEGLHALLSALDPKEVTNIAKSIVSELTDSGNPMADAYSNIFKDIVKSYVKAGVTDENIIYEEILVRASDIFKSTELLKSGRPLEVYLGKTKKRLENLLVTNKVMNKAFNNYESFSKFLELYPKYLTNEKALVINKIKNQKKGKDQSITIGNTRYSLNLSEEEKALKKRKEEVINNQKLQVMLKKQNDINLENGIITKEEHKSNKEKYQNRIDLNKERIKGINKNIEEAAKKDYVSKKTGKVISKKSREITQRNKEIWYELSDKKNPLTDQQKEQLRNELLELNRGTIISVANKRMSSAFKKLEADGQVKELPFEREDLIQALSLEFFTIANQFNPVLGVPWNSYLKARLKERSIGILGNLQGAEAYEKTSSISGLIGNQQLVQEHVVYGNITEEEYRSKMTSVIKTLGITDEIRDVFVDKAKHVLETLDMSKSIKKQISLAFRTETYITKGKHAGSDLKVIIMEQILGSFKKKRNKDGLLYQDYLEQNWEDIYSILPRDVLTGRTFMMSMQEKAEGTKQPFYFKIIDPVTGKYLREKTAAGKIVTKKRTVTKDEFLSWFLGDRKLKRALDNKEITLSEYYDRTTGSSTLGTRKDTLAEAMAEQIGFDLVSEILNSNDEFVSSLKNRHIDTQDLSRRAFINDIQRQIDRHEGYQPISTRFSLIINAANKHGISQHDAVQVLEYVKKNEYPPIKFGKAFTDAYEEISWILSQAREIKQGMYHGSYELDLKKQDLSKFKIDGLGIHFGTLYAAQDRLENRKKHYEALDQEIPKSIYNRIDLFLDPNKEIFIPNDSDWERIDSSNEIIKSILEQKGVSVTADNMIDESQNKFGSGYVSEDMVDETLIEDVEFSDEDDYWDAVLKASPEVVGSVELLPNLYLYESGYINAEEAIDEGSTAEGLRNLLAGKGYTHIKYINQWEDINSVSYIILDKQILQEGVNGTSEVRFDMPLSEKEGAIRAQKLAKFVQIKSKGEILSSKRVSKVEAIGKFNKKKLFGPNLVKKLAYIPYQADDLNGLLQMIYPSGKIGDDAFTFFKNNIWDPYYEGKRKYRKFEKEINQNYNGLFDKLYLDPIKGKGRKDGVVTEELRKIIAAEDAELSRLVEKGKISIQEKESKLEELDIIKLNIDTPFTKQTLNKRVSVGDVEYTIGMLIKFWLYDRNQDLEIKKTSKKIESDIIAPEIVNAAKNFMASPDNKKFEIFAGELESIIGVVRYDVKKAERKIIDDVYRYIEGRRKEFFEEFKINREMIFNQDNLNRLHALYGPSYEKELTFALDRMYAGDNFVREDKNPGAAWATNWANGSVNAIMFWNSRSAVLQLLSSINFLNWTDNNPMQAGKAFANQGQFWSDVAMLMKDDYLVDRRSNLKFDIEADKIAEIGNQVFTGEKDTKQAFKKFYAKIAKFGYIPTRVADSFAIAFGGAAFYRNRYNSYLKQYKADVKPELLEGKLSQLEKKAHEKTMLDFERIAEESQQSSDPSRISSLQIGNYGRMLFAFANTPFQYARLSKRAALDIIHGRGDLKTNITKLLWYSAVQQMVFTALQSALAFEPWLSEEEEEDEKDRMTDQDRIALYYTLNGVLENHMKMFGLSGVGAMAAKNVIIGQYRDKMFREGIESHGLFTPQRANAFTIMKDITSISPPISNKFRLSNDLYKLENWAQNREKADYYHMDDFWYLFPQDPTWEKIGKWSNIAINMPLDRLIKKAENLSFAFDNQTNALESLLLTGGWTKFNILERNKWDLPYPELDSEVYKKYKKIKSKIEKMEKKYDPVLQHQKKIDKLLKKYNNN
jgi:hypothetical protein